MNQLLTKLKDLVAQERRINAEVIRHLVLVSEKRLHLQMGYASLFSFCVEYLGYSEAAASRRVQAVKLSAQIESIPEKLEKGVLSFNALAQAQSFFRQEKIQDLAAKKEVLANLENKSLRQTENYLKTLANKPATHTLEISQVLLEELRALQIQLGKASVEEVIVVLVKEKTEKMEKRKTPQGRSSASRYVPRETKRELFQNPQCSYQDPVTGKRCQSQYKLQIDHIRPYALGGKTEPQNLRLLCRNHNLFLAEQIFGRLPTHEFRGKFPGVFLKSMNESRKGLKPHGVGGFGD